MKYNYKLILFDFGGVVIDYDVNQDLLGVAKELNIDPEQFRNKFFALIKEVTKKGLDEMVIFQSLSDEFISINARELREVMKQSFAKNIQLRQEVIDWISVFKQKITVACLTNTIGLHLEVNKARGYMAVFDKVFASNEIGVRKPDLAAYQIVTDYYKISSEEVIFLDDKESYCEGAINFGFKTFHVPTYDELISRLKEIRSLLS